MPSPESVTRKTIEGDWIPALVRLCSPLVAGMTGGGDWIPASAGMTGEETGMTEEEVGMTGGIDPSPAPGAASPSRGEAKIGRGS